MVPSSQRRSGGWSLTLRLTVALSAGAFFVALLLAFLGADHEDDVAARLDAGLDRDLAASLAARAAPLLDRGDVMRLSVMAALARDQAEGRVIVLDQGGRVLLDTALMQGGRQLGLLTHDGGFQRTTERADGAVMRESLAPIRLADQHIGEVRLQRELRLRQAGFDLVWFGLAFLSCLTLVAVAAIMGHHWTARVRSATDALIRLSAGEVGGVASDAAEGELHDLGSALREMERGVQDGLQRVGEGYVAMALQVVDGMEHARLVPPGHGERTAHHAMRLADRLQLLPADRSDVELACRLVDLGKAWVRPSILQKQQLSEVEAQSLRHHPVHAADHLDCVPGLRRVARIVRHQLERYDGKGSPDGLRGDRIPLGSRIVAIAASFDLLTTCATERPLDWQQALQQMAEARGEVFDPWLLDVFDEEIRREPPAEGGDRPVMIVPAGSMPWRHADAGAADEDGSDDADFGADELEVMLDEGNREDAP